MKGFKFDGCRFPAARIGSLRHWTKADRYQQERYALLIQAVLKGSDAVAIIAEPPIRFTV